MEESVDGNRVLSTKVVFQLMTLDRSFKICLKCGMLFHKTIRKCKQCKEFVAKATLNPKLGGVELIKSSSGRVDYQNAGQTQLTWSQTRPLIVITTYLVHVFKNHLVHQTCLDYLGIQIAMEILHGSSAIMAILVHRVFKEFQSDPNYRGVWLTLQPIVYSILVFLERVYICNSFRLQTHAQACILVIKTFMDHKPQDD